MWLGIDNTESQKKKKNKAKNSESVANIGGNKKWHKIGQVPLHVCTAQLALIFALLEQMSILTSEIITAIV